MIVKRSYFVHRICKRQDRQPKDFTMSIGISTTQFTGKTFSQRKAERKAAGNVQFRFVVMCNEPGHATEQYGEFNSRAAAEAFAFEQCGPLIGNTLAANAFYDAHRGEMASRMTCPRFCVVRKQA